MEKISYSKRLFRFLEIIFSSPFFLFLFLSVIATVILFILAKKSVISMKYLKKFIAIIYIGIALIIVIKYFDSIFLVFDAFVDKLFTVLYFPNIISYICMVLVTLLVMLYSVFNKKVSLKFKVVNFISFLTISFLFILVMDTIATLNIDVNERISLYSNTDVTVLIQASMVVFGLWMFGLFISFIVNVIANSGVPKKGDSNK